MRLLLAPPPIPLIAPPLLVALPPLAPKLALSVSVNALLGARLATVSAWRGGATDALVGQRHRGRRHAGLCQVVADGVDHDRLRAEVKRRQPAGAGAVAGKVQGDLPALVAGRDAGQPDA